MTDSRRKLWYNHLIVERFSAPQLLEVLPLGVIIQDLSGNIIYSNQEAANLLKLERTELERRSNQSPEWIVTDEDNRRLEPHEYPVGITLQTHEPAAGTISVLRTDGTIIWIHVRSIPLVDETGQMTAVLVAFLDCTERIRARKEAEAMRRFQRNSAAAFAHEVRTPLTIALGFLELITEGQYGDLNERQRQLVTETVIPRLRDIVRIAQHCVSLLLQEDGTLANFGEVDIAAVLNKTIKDLSIIAKRKYNVSIRRYVQRGIKVWGRADLLGFMFSNLITNAAKFTPAGGRVIVSSHVEGDEYIVTVQDTGIGISEEDLPHIFKPFYQVSHGNTRRYEGVGMGLSAMQTFADIHKARVSVESVLGKGSTFRLFFPLDSPSEQP